MPLVCYVSELEKNVSLDAERLLRLLGVSGKLSGFHFAVYMLEQVQEKPEYVLLITKRLYSQTAQYFHTTANCVERNLRTLVQACWKLPINLSFACSLRIGEIVGLTWDNIHISDADIANDNAYLCVEKELARVKESSLAILGEEEIIKKFPRTMYLENASTVIVLKTPKTESSVRKVWMPKTVAYILREWKDSQDKQKEFLGDEYLDYNLVVALPNGRPCEETVISNAFRRLKRDAKLPNVVFHSLRHSSTTYKLKLNHGDIKATQGDTGHSQADMVTKVYAHILDEDRKVNAQKFESAFYANPDLRSVKAPDEPQTALDVQSIIVQLQQSPELLSALTSLISNQGCK